MKMKRWVEITNEDETWLLDMEFLLSGFACSFGQGCPGINGSADIGCCAIGTPLFDEEMKDVEKRVSQLTPEVWQNYGKKWKKRKRRKGYSNYNTVIHKHTDGVEGCVFANRSDFHSGAGCAFHTAALAHGENPIDWKPETCWQVPIGVIWSSSVNAHVIRQVSRADWTDGYDDWDVVEWWCSDDDRSWANATPMYQSHAEELKRISILNTGSDKLYSRIKVVCDYYWENMPKPEQKAVPVTLISRNSKDY